METAALSAATPLLCQGERKKLLTCGEYSTGATRENVTIRLPLNSLAIANAPNGDVSAPALLQSDSH